jgi:type II secretory pathway predicted ATPase ExeA
MLSEVLDHFGFARDFYGAGYHETPYHRQVLQNLRGAIHAGRLIAFTGLVGSGKTLLLRQLRDILVAEKRRHRVEIARRRQGTQQPGDADHRAFL